MKYVPAIILCFAFLSFRLAYTQNAPLPIDENNDYNQTPPSPTAYELGKYGQIPVGYFTGTANINVPLYTFKVGKLSVPLSLSYNSNGIKVDQLESNVGLGWSLNAGGVITRIVKDEPDEESYQFFPDDEIHNAGVHSPISMQYFVNALTEGMDNEADVFMFNFNGYSGKFTFDNEKRILLVPHQDIKITPYMNDGQYCFKITTPTGISYFFSDIEKTIYIQTLNSGSGSNKSPEGNPPRTTAWYLSQITDPAGDTIQFNYSGNNYSYINSISQMHKKSLYSGFTHCGTVSCNTLNTITTYNNYSHILGKQIAQITSNKPDNGQVNIQYNQGHPQVQGYNLISNLNIKNKYNQIIENYDLHYLTTSNNRLFLSNVTYKDTTKKYLFYYDEPELLCERNSMSQDYWGYYNNKPNNYLVPQIDNHYVFSGSTFAGNRGPSPQYAQKGLLNKMQYPTGGTTKFDYEPNSYWGQQTIYPPFVTLDIDAITDNNTFSFQGIDTTEEILFTQEVDINASVEFNDFCPDCDTNGYPWQIKASIYVKNINTNEKIDLYQFSSVIGYYSVGIEPSITDGKNEAFKATLEAGSKYEVSIKVFKPCQRSNINFHYYDQDIQVVDKNIITGGLRIKKITSTDSISGKNNIQTFYYNKFSNLSKSSGDPGAKGYYISKKVNRKTCGTCAYIDCDYYVLSSNSLIPLINTGNNNIYYKFVTVSNGGDNFETGGETHEFIINRDIQGNPIVGYEYVQNGVAYSNTGWNNGLEKSVEYFRVDANVKIPVTLIDNFYTNDQRNFKSAYSYSISKNFDIICSTPLYKICTQEDIDDFYIYKHCINNSPEHNHIYWHGVNYTTCIGSGANNVFDTIFDSCYLHQVGDTIIYSNQIENLNVTEYQNLSFWHYLDSTIVYHFNQDGNNPLATSSKYVYDNEEHIQLSHEKTVDSKGNLNQNNYYYPQDYSDIENYDTLIAQNIIANPVKVETEVNSNLTTGKILKYNDDGQTIQVLNFEASNPVLNPSIDTMVLNNLPYYYKEKLNLFYDPLSKKPIEYLKVDNYPITYLWGYNYTHVVAKIENATFTQVATALGCTYEELQSKTDTALIVLFGNLRNSLPIAIITSYTYKPLVGMLTETDPAGNTITYDYDSFNRLETVRDQDGNIVKHIDYHYKDE